MRDNPTVTIVVDRKQADEFLDCLSSTFQTMSAFQRGTAYFWVEKRDAVAISYNAQWKPFLGYTAGYNPEDERTPIVGWSSVLSEIKDIMRKRPHGISGGRVFLRDSGAFRVVDGAEVQIRRWVWLGDGLIRSTLALLDRFKFRNQAPSWLS